MIDQLHYLLQDFVTSPFHFSCDHFICYALCSLLTNLLPNFSYVVVYVTILLNAAFLSLSLSLSLSRASVGFHLLSCALMYSGVYGDVIRVKIMFNKKDTALIQFSDAGQAQIGGNIYIDIHASFNYSSMVYNSSVFTRVCVIICVMFLFNLPLKICFKM